MQLSLPTHLLSCFPDQRVEDAGICTLEQHLPTVAPLEPFDRRRSRPQDYRSLVSSLRVCQQVVSKVFSAGSDLFACLTLKAEVHDASERRIPQTLAVA